MSSREQLVESLVARGLRAEPLHGGMSQAQRERVMARLRSRSADLLLVHGDQDVSDLHAGSGGRAFWDELRYQ